MKPFLKENATLILALALPLLFALFFYISKTAVTANTAPPAHDFLIWDANGTYDVAVVNGALEISLIYPTLYKNQPVTVQQPRLYYVRAGDMIAEPVHVTIPDDARKPSPQKQGTPHRLDTGKLKTLSFNAASISPDGFALSQSTYRDGNLMTEIFSGHRADDDNLALAKDGARFPIRGLDHVYGMKIVGWVVPSGANVPTDESAQE